MRKGVSFISVGLTAFVIAVLSGVVYAYKNVNSIPNKQQSVSVSVPMVAMAATPVQTVSAQDAAALAAKDMNRTDLYSVELADLNGVQVYKVTFSSGDVAYMSLTGQLISTEAPKPTVVTVQQNSHRGKNGGGGSSANSGGGEHEGGDN